MKSWFLVFSFTLSWKDFSLYKPNEALPVRKNILNALEHAHDCLGSTLSIFGMDGENPFPSKGFEHDYIHIDSYNYGVIELIKQYNVFATVHTVMAVELIKGLEGGVMDAGYCFFAD